MERLIERLSMARRALATLREAALRPEPTPLERDGAVQRFEYTFEAVWKLAQLFLSFVEGQAVGSPKSTIRASRAAGLLSDAETVRALQMADDRNRTVHTYIEALAVEIQGRLPGQPCTPSRRARPFWPIFNQACASGAHRTKVRFRSGSRLR